eukprot:COSAG05_NODE_292_length_12012_cov_12.968354_11_plen_119_part_00
MQARPEEEGGGGGPLTPAQAAARSAGVIIDEQVKLPPQPLCISPLQKTRAHCMDTEWLTLVFVYGGNFLGCAAGGVAGGSARGDEAIRSGSDLREFPLHWRPTHSVQTLPSCSRSHSN